MPTRITTWRVWLSIVWIVLALCSASWVGYRLATTQALETNLLALLPPTERNPLAESAVTQLSANLGNRAIYLVGHPNSKLAHELASAFAENLRRSGAFSKIHELAPKIDFARIGDFYVPYQVQLLTPTDNALLGGGDFDPLRTLVHRIHQPFATGLTTPIANDPLGFLQNWLNTLPLTHSRLSIESGHLAIHTSDMTWVMLLGELPDSAYDARVQNRVLAATETASRQLSQNAESRLLHTGAVFYGAAARSSAEHEVDLIGAGSLLGILLMMWWLFRSLRPLALALLTVAVGLCHAFALTLAVFGQLHLITLVFGASLIGEAVDYAIQYFAAQLDAGENWHPIRGLRRVFRPLAIALATSLIGYGALAMTPLPAIGQIATFAFTGLATAWISVVLLLPLLTRRPLKRNADAATRVPRALLAQWNTRMNPGRAFILIFGLIVVSIPGLLKLRGNDDIRLLVSRPVQLQTEEETIRALAGTSGSSRFFLIEGNSWEEVLQREEALGARLHEAGSPVPLAISSFVPSRETQANNRAQLLKHVDARTQLSKAFSELGLRDEIATHWLNRVAAQPVYLTPEDWLQQEWSRPFQYLVVSSAAPVATLLIPQGAEQLTNFAALADGLPGVTPVDKGASVSALFQRVRGGAMWWLPLAALIVGLVLFWRYGLRNGAAILLPTLLGMGVALAVYGYSGQALTLFSLMGLMLVLGVGANYSIFLVEAGEHAPASFAGVLLSAATTLLAFGLLSLSSMPALKHFGLMLLIGISASVLLSPLALTLAKKR